MTDTPDLEQISRKIASLALEERRQGGGLRVRQREQLRRALAIAAESLGWDHFPGDDSARVASAIKHVSRLGKAGAEDLEKALAAEFASKKAEIKALDKVTGRIRKLAGDEGAEYPTEVEYTRTSRSALGHLVTKTELLTLNDASEAESAADTLDRKRDGFTKLRDEMLEELKRKNKELAETRTKLDEFSAAHAGLVNEVLATLT
jgi:hypothetical protein